MSGTDRDNLVSSAEVGQAAEGPYAAPAADQGAGQGSAPSLLSYRPFARSSCGI